MKMTHSFLRVATALIAFLFGGCMGNSHRPLETLAYTADPIRNKHLIVFLRGLGGTWRCPWEPHKCFESEGFVEAVRKRSLPFDMVAPNAHFGYYKDRTLIERLTEDVILPAKTKGSAIKTAITTPKSCLPTVSPEIGSYPLVADMIPSLLKRSGRSFWTNKF